MLATPAGKTPPADPKAIYMKGFYLFHNRDYTASRKAFEAYLKLPSDDFSDNARFWIGECFYMQKKYRQAGASYQRVLSDYSGSNKTPEAMLKLGVCFRHLKDAKKAREIWRALVKQYPESRAAAAARKHLSR